MGLRTEQVRAVSADCRALEQPTTSFFKPGDASGVACLACVTSGSAIFPLPEIRFAPNHVDDEPGRFFSGCLARGNASVTLPGNLWNTFKRPGLRDRPTALDLNLDLHLDRRVGFAEAGNLRLELATMASETSKATTPRGTI